MRGIEKKAKEAWLKRFGNHIKAIRTEKKVTASDLAGRVSMEKSNFSRLEKGRVNPSVYLIKQICDALEMDLSDFYKGLK